MARTAKRMSAPKRTTMIIGGVAVLGLSAVGAAVASGGAVEARDDDASDTAISGDALAKATEAALASTGGGTVTGSEVGDEESMYEVEVTIDGSQVDVQLDENFRVVATEGDEEGGDE